MYLCLLYRGMCLRDLETSNKHHAALIYHDNRVWRMCHTVGSPCACHHRLLDLMVQLLQVYYNELWLMWHISAIQTILATNIWKRLSTVVSDYTLSVLASARPKLSYIWKVFKKHISTSWMSTYCSCTAKGGQRSNQLLVPQDIMCTECACTVKDCTFLTTLSMLCKAAVHALTTVETM